MHSITHLRLISVTLARYILKLLYPRLESKRFFIYLTIQYIVEQNFRKMYEDYQRFGLKCEVIPEIVTAKIVERNMKTSKSWINHQCVLVPSFIFDKLFQENIFYRDDNSLWAVMKICDENNIVADVKSLIQPLKAISTSKRSNKTSSENQIFSERIVQIIPSIKSDKSNTVYMNDIEFFNLKQNVYSDDLRLKFTSITSENHAPKIASVLVVEMVLTSVQVGLDLTDQMLMNYFKKPKYFHLNDYFAIDMTEEYTNNLHYKYFNVVKNVKRLIFKCVKIQSKDLSNEADGDPSIGYFVAIGETELKQNQNFNSFIPRSLYLTFESDIVLDDGVYENYIESCPYGLDKYFYELKDCIEPFLIRKEVNLINTHIKCTLQPIFLLRCDIGSGYELIVKSLAENLGLHFISETCRRIVSSTAKQTESKIESLIHKAKKSSPALVLIQDFDIFGLESDKSEDVRITEYLIKKLNDLYLTFTNLPIIFIFSCDPSHEFKSNLKRLFLEELQILLPDTDDRLNNLVWLCLTKRVSLLPECDNQSSADGDAKNVSNIENNCRNRMKLLIKLMIKDEFLGVLKNVAAKTEGYNFGDLDSLLDQVIYNSYLNQKENDTEEMLANSPNIGLARKEDFEHSLEKMRKLHSKKYGTVRIPNVDWDDIGGLDQLKKEIFRTIELPLKYPHLLANTGLNRSGLLLWGPPGCGKTLVARAIASQLKATFLSVKGPELLDMYVGQSEKNMRDIFSAARSSAPCVIFLDEAEAVAGARGSTGDAGGAADRLVSQLLAELDGVAAAENRQKAPVIVIAATNRPDLVEPALLRPGRLDKLLYVGPYVGVGNKVRVIKAASRSFNLSEDVDLNTIAGRLPEQCTGADLASIVNNSRRKALVRTINRVENGEMEPSKLSESDVVIEMADFLQSIDQFTPSVSFAEMSHYESLRTKLS